MNKAHRDTGQRGRARLAPREGSPRERRNAALATQAEDQAFPLVLDEEGRATLQPIARVAKIAAPETESDHTLNTLIDALIQGGIMED